MLLPADTTVIIVGILQKNLTIRICNRDEPKRLITLDYVTQDGFGGHVDALYEHTDMLQAALSGLVPAISQGAKTAAH